MATTRRRRGRKANATGRNDTEQFIPLTYAMVRSDAWRSLSGPAVKIWVEVRSRFNGRNNGDLSLSLDQAAQRLGVSKSTAARAFKELQNKGFIKMSRQGNWHGRQATTWAVTDRTWNGHIATHDWKHWRPPKPCKKTESRYSGGTNSRADGAV
jgi:AraC-like DNA-binding protein